MALLVFGVIYLLAIWLREKYGIWYENIAIKAIYVQWHGLQMKRRKIAKRKKKKSPGTEA